MSKSRLQRLVWLRRRLGRMYVREVPHRLATLALTLAQSRGFLDARRVPAERADARFGRDWCLVPARVPDGLLEAAEDLRDGRLDVFGSEVDVHPDRIDWNRDPLTGVAIPPRFGPLIDFRHLGQVDIKFLWEVNRQLWWVTLAQAWGATGDAGWLEALAGVLRSWLRQCPYPLGPNWSSPVEHGVRLINWSLCWQLIGGAQSPMFDGPEGAALRRDWLASIYQHIRFASDHYSRYSSANNHLIGEAAGVFVATQTWDLWPECSRLREAAKRILEQEMLKQFRADGVNEEQALCYHKFSLQFMLAAGLSGRANGDDFSPVFWRRLETAVVYLAAQMDCRGGVPLYGDADEGAVFCLDPRPEHSPYQALLEIAARLFGNEVLAAKLASLVEGTQSGSVADWLLGEGAPSAADGQLLDRLPRSFNAGGYLLLGDRLHQPGERRILIDVGPLGSNKICGHGHADALAITLSADGRPLLIDPGTYCYNAEPALRHFFRSTAAHNTLVVDGEDQSVYGGSFLWLSDINVEIHEQTSDSVHASHDGYRRLRDPVRHHRRIRWRDDLLLVEDWLEAAEAHEVSINWHLPAEAVLRGAANSFRADCDGYRLDFEFEASGALSSHTSCGGIDPLQGWTSDAFYQRRPAPVLTAQTRLSPSALLRTRICCVRV